MGDNTYKIIKTDGNHPVFADLCQELNDELNAAVPERKGVRDSTVDLDKIGDVFLACDSNNVIGSMGLKHINQNMCELVRVYIKPEYRGKGVARKLVKCIDSLAQKKGYKLMTLITVENGSNPEKVYEKFGFEVINDDGFTGESVLDSHTIYMIKEVKEKTDSL